MFSIDDMLSLQLRFTLRAIKGIRQGNKEKIVRYLPTAVSFFLSLMNRLHIDLTDALWKKFPGRCSYCGGTPCSCPSNKKRIKTKLASRGTKPRTVAEFQTMFQKIYPKYEKDLLMAGIHLAEEAGEISEALHNYMGQHKPGDFPEIEKESADFASCFFTTASAAGIELAPLLASFTENGCRACGKSQCQCTFDYIIQFR